MNDRSLLDIKYIIVYHCISLLDVKQVGQGLERFTSNEILLNDKELVLFKS